MIKFKIASPSEAQSICDYYGTEAILKYMRRDDGNAAYSVGICGFLTDDVLKESPMIFLLGTVASEQEAEKLIAHYRQGMEFEVVMRTPIRANGRGFERHVPRLRHIEK